MGRGSVWDDNEVVPMDGSGRCRAVNVRMATELYPETCSTVSVVCLLHHNRKIVSQEAGATASPGGPRIRDPVSWFLLSHSAPFW